MDIFIEHARYKIALHLLFLRMVVEDVPLQMEVLVKLLTTTIKCTGILSIVRVNAKMHHQVTLL